MMTAQFFSIELSDGTFVRVISRAYARHLVTEQGIADDDFHTYPGSAVRDCNGYTFFLKGAHGAKALVCNDGSVLLKL